MILEQALQGMRQVRMRRSGRRTSRRRRLARYKSPILRDSLPGHETGSQGQRPERVDNYDIGGWPLAGLSNLSFVILRGYDDGAEFSSR